MTYGTRPSAHYIARRQAAQAGGAAVNFLGGQVVVGDGNGSVPAISDLVAAGGVVHEVWRGSVITSVTQNVSNLAQIDIRFVIPSSVGGFWIREFCILDELGQPCVYGTTLFEKTSPEQGQPSDLSMIAALAESDASVVVLSPPSADFVTISAMQAAINAHQPTAEEPLYASDTTSQGWLQRLFKIRRATQAQIGVERPANDAEFAAGVGSVSPWPWPTIAQVKNAIQAVVNALTVSGEGVTINAQHQANLDFPALTADSAPASADLIAVYKLSQSHHRKVTLSDFLAWLAAQISPMGPGLGQVIVTGAAAGFLNQNPADWGYTIGMTVTAQQLTDGNIPGVTTNTLTPYSGAPATERSYWFGPITGNWQLVGWSWCNSAGFIAVFNFYWRRIS